MESLTATKNEIHKQLYRLASQPNRREILEANIRRLCNEIRMMEVDQNKMNIIERQYKRVEYLQSDIDMEKKIISMENLLQATLDKIQDLNEEKR